MQYRGAIVANFLTAPYGCSHSLNFRGCPRARFPDWGGCLVTSCNLTYLQAFLQFLMGFTVETLLPCFAEEQVPPLHPRVQGQSNGWQISQLHRRFCTYKIFGGGKSCCFYSSRRVIFPMMSRTAAQQPSSQSSMFSTYTECLPMGESQCCCSAWKWRC